MWGRGVMVRRCSQRNVERDPTECAPGFGSRATDWKQGRRKTPEAFYKRQRKGLSPEPGEGTLLANSIMPRFRRYVSVPRATESEQEDTSGTCIWMSDAPGSLLGAISVSHQLPAFLARTPGPGRGHGLLLGLPPSSSPLGISVSWCFQ